MERTADEAAPGGVYQQSRRQPSLLSLRKAAAAERSMGLVR